jgi:hypothetical protein
MRLIFDDVISGNALDELHLDDPLNLVDSIHRDTNSPIGNSISAGLASSGLLGSSAPVNIPGMAERSVLTNFSPSTSSPLQQLQTSFLTGSRFSHQDSMESVSSYVPLYARVIVRRYHEERYRLNFIDDDILSVLLLDIAIHESDFGSI